MSLWKIALAAVVLVVFTASSGMPEAASTKPKKKTEVSASLRARAMADARKLCKAKLGPTSTVYSLVIKSDRRSYSVRCTAY